MFFKQIDLIGPQLKLAHKLREEIDHDRGEEQAIDAVEDAAVAGDDLAAVFDVGVNFEIPWTIQADILLACCLLLQLLWPYSI